MIPGIWTYALTFSWSTGSPKDDLNGSDIMGPSDNGGQGWRIL